jgi:peroxiredoxin Q/BCP
LKPAVGNLAPALSGDSTAGKIKLRDLRGQFVVVYFYPKDNTPGCTKEAQDFRDLAKAFKKANAIVIGVSSDSIASHEKFRDKQSLDFALVSDPDDVWGKAFDVIHEKSLYGRKFIGVVRSTFLIDPDGRLIAEWRGVRVPGHANVVLEAIKTASR